jgi:drug/metabolite transporter (DMT)-like permease
MMVVWFRFGVAFSILFVYFLIRDPKKLIIFLKPPFLLIVAALGLVANYIGFAIGVDLTSPGNAQIFIQLGPMILAAVGIIFFQERLSFRQYLGFVVAIAGLIFFYRDQLVGTPDSQQAYMVGVIWLIMAAVTWAVYASLQKKLVEKYAPQELNMFIYGLPLILLIPSINSEAFSQLSFGMWVLLISLGINTVVAYGCLAEAFRYIEANKISVIITLNPILTFIIMMFLSAMEVSWIKGENLSSYGFGGAAMVLAGAIMVVIPKRGFKKEGTVRQKEL